MWRRQLFDTLPTDLAAERYQQNLGDKNISFASKRQGVIEIEEIAVKQKNATIHYTTLTFPPSFELTPNEYLEATKVIANQIASLLPPKIDMPLMVVGLGNPSMTVDALGQETVNMISATAHLHPSGICVYAPGVTEATGVATEKGVLGMVNVVHPRAVIVIDALCARSPSRLGNTIQLSNAGISPGSGLGRTTTSLSHKTLGVPVIAIGVPTLISTQALLLEAVSDVALSEPPPNFSKLLEDQFLYVCPKDIDNTILRAAALLGDAINSL